MTIIIRPKNREEWLEHRKGGIGSSEVSSILGINPYQTPYQLWRRKKEMDPEVEQNMPMRLGHLLEDAVSTLWSEETNREVIQASSIDWIAVDRVRPYFRASPDRTFWLPNMKRNHKNKGILECKTTQMTVDEEDLPKTWFCQLQWLLGVSRTEQGSLAWLSAGRSFGYKDIQLVPDFFAWMQEEVERFWIDNIVGNIEPPAINADDILVKYNHHTDGKLVEVGPEIAEAYTELKTVKEELKRIEDHKDELENRIKMTFEDAEMITYAGSTLATWKTAKESNRLDAKALAQAHPSIAAQFTRPVPGSRRFMLK